MKRHAWHKEGYASSTDVLILVFVRGEEEVRDAFLNNP